MKRSLLLFATSLIMLSCSQKAGPTKDDIDAISLKSGELISCGPGEQQLGSLDFETSCGEKVKDKFNVAVKLLHSFEYDEAEKVFAKIIREEPGCAMAYWGVAMSNFHPLWMPPTEQELKKGYKAVQIAQSIEERSTKETAYIDAIAAFYNEYDKVDHRTRCARFEKGMENIYTKYPDDKESAIFYALSLVAAADPADKSFQKQKKAGSILDELYRTYPNHPGVVHYLIHTYDLPELADMGLVAAKRYASVAPSSAHALHMPSHIFTRLGYWNECISSNLASVSSAQCYAEGAGIKGRWDEELHAMDYLMYAYLQKGDNKLAQKQWNDLNSMKEVNPVNFKVAYAFAAIPSRYLMENKLWKEAANLKVDQQIFPWKNFPWQSSIIHFTRAIGAAHIKDMNVARAALKELNDAHGKLVELKDNYKANLVQIQIKSAEAWMQFAQGNKDEALKLMALAADMEEKTEKHPVTPGEVIPARELLGDMLLEMGKADQAFEAYEANNKKHPNRFNGLYGAAQAAERSGKYEKAQFYYQALATTAAGSARPELAAAGKFVKK